MGSSGSKPRKPKQRQQHLPKVGSKANVEYEIRERRQEVFGGFPMIVAGVLILALLIGFVIITI